MRIIIDEIKNIIAKSNYNINIASFPIRNVLNNMPVGTKLEIDVCCGSDGMLQSVYEKKSTDIWSKTWRVKNGEIYWTVDQCADCTASAIFNDFYYNDI